MGRVQIASIIFMLFALSSCKTNTSDSLQGHRVALKYLKSVNFELDSRTRNFSFCSQYIHNESVQYQKIAILNAANNSIQFYGLNGKKINELYFQKEGPDGVGFVQAFYCQNADSLYILNANNHKIYCASVNGKILKTYALPLYSDNRYFSIPWAQDGAQMMRYRDSLYIMGIPGINYDKNPNEFLSKGKLSIALNLRTGEADFRIPYPNKVLFETNIYPSQLVTPKCIYNNRNELIYSFRADHQVYQYHRNGTLMGKYSMKSKFAETFIKPLKGKYELGDPMYEFMYETNILVYENLIFDPYRELYYRIVRKNPKAIFTGKELKKGVSPDFEFSVIIADKNLNIIDEIILPKKTGSATFMAIPDGLLIQKENENEDVKTFDLFRLEFL